MNKVVAVVVLSIVLLISCNMESQSTVNGRAVDDLGVTDLVVTYDWLSNLSSFLATTGTLQVTLNGVSEILATNAKIFKNSNYTVLYAETLNSDYKVYLVIPGLPIGSFEAKTCIDDFRTTKLNYLSFYYSYKGSDFVLASKMKVHKYRYQDNGGIDILLVDNVNKCNFSVNGNYSGITSSYGNYGENISGTFQATFLNNVITNGSYSFINQ